MVNCPGRCHKTTVPPATTDVIGAAALSNEANISAITGVVSYAAEQSYAKPTGAPSSRSHRGAEGWHVIATVVDCSPAVTVNHATFVRRQREIAPDARVNIPHDSPATTFQKDTVVIYITGHGNNTSASTLNRTNMAGAARNVVAITTTQRGRAPTGRRRGRHAPVLNSDEVSSRVSWRNGRR